MSGDGLPPVDVHDVHDAPVVIVVPLHVPFAVVVFAILLASGVALMIFCTIRFRRRFHHGWIVVSMGAALVALVSLTGLVTYFVRSLR